MSDDDTPGPVWSFGPEILIYDSLTEGPVILLEPGRMI